MFYRNLNEKTCIGTSIGSSLFWIIWISRISLLICLLLFFSFSSFLISRIDENLQGILQPPGETALWKIRFGVRCHNSWLGGKPFDLSDYRCFLWQANCYCLLLIWTLSGTLLSESYGQMQVANRPGDFLGDASNIFIDQIFFVCFNPKFNQMESNQAISWTSHSDDFKSLSFSLKIC